MFEVDLEDGAALRFLGRIKDRLRRPEHLLDVLVDELHLYERDVFDSAGNGAWPALSDRTVALKGSSRPLYDSGDMFDQLTSSEEISGEEAEIRAPAYFHFHKTGTSRMPRRDPAPELPAGVVNKLGETLLDEIIGVRR